MGFDAQLKRLFPLVLCALIAMVAYLQASGITALVGATVADSPGAGPKPVAAAGPAGSTMRRSDGRSILERNAFDSVTGPIVGGARSIGDAPDGPDADGSAKPFVAGGNPLDDPPCKAGKLHLTIESDDPAWSFAAITDTAGERKLRRIGDTVGDQTLQYVSWDRVWMSTGSARCQLKVGEGSAGTAKAKTGPKATPKKSTRRRRGRGRQIPPEMAAKIHRVSDSEFNVERSVVDQILENQAELMRSARIVPEKEGDKVVGIRLFGIRKGTLLETLGLKNGDRLESINGFAMSDPQKALEAYGRLRTADHLKVAVNRKGKPVTIDFNIQ